MFQDEEWQISLAEFGSKAYDEAVALRTEVLRKPLGLQYTPEQLKAEESQVHIVAMDKEQVIGVLLMQPISESEVKMRQFAVAEDWQGKGIGTDLVAYAEEWAILHKYHQITLHARKAAVPFYLHLGYEVQGHEFVEVGIPHLKMEKFFG